MVNEVMFERKSLGLFMSEGLFCVWVQDAIWECIKAAVEGVLGRAWHAWIWRLESGIRPEPAATCYFFPLFYGST